MKRKHGKKKQASPPAVQAPLPGSPGSPGWLPVLLLAVVAALLYAGTLGHGYVVDDDTVMAKNEIVKKGVSAIPEIFTTRYRAGFWERKENMYRPLSLALFAAEWQLAPGNPLPGHAMNILLYMLTAVLLFRLLRMMVDSDLVPFIATLLFIAHPLHVEVVANIKSRDEILGLLFGLAALQTALAFHERRKPLFLLASAVLFMAALLSKENAIMLLFLAPLTLYFFTSFRKKAVRNVVLTWVATTACYFAIRLAVLGSLGTETEIQLVNNSLLGATDGLSRLATAIFIMGKYLWLLAVPHPLVFDYSYNQIAIVKPGDLRAVASLVVVLALLVYAIKTFGRKSPYSYCILFFGISISLVSNFFFLIESTMAERFLYFPSVAFCLAMAVLLTRLFKGPSGADTPGGALSSLKSRPVLAAVLAVVAGLYSVKTVARSACWKDNLTLLAADVKTSPESARIRYAYGSAILFEQALKEDNPAQKTRRLDEAIAHLQKGVSILSTYADAYYHLGLAYKEKEDYQSAISSFESARRSKSYKLPEFYVASGICYGSVGRYAEAIADLKTALTFDSAFFDAYNNLGIYYTESDNPEEALAALLRARELRPENEKVLYNLGNVYARAGDYHGAIRMYKEALAINDRYEDACNNIGNSYAAMKDYPNAIVYYEKVIALDPSNKKALNNLGITYKMLGDHARGDHYLNLARIP